MSMIISSETLLKPNGPFGTPPWEMEEFLRNFDTQKYCEENLPELSELKTEPQCGFEVGIYSHIHIGSINAYPLDETTAVSPS